ncbi:MAG: hypothetical protein DRP42_05150 [Tenericutes bacterium]|nr:MAG: hypothetical protein DRP42_05150 [Mycoplasmatota bacterium]
MINIAFEDFKRLALENNKRIYYYIRDDVMELFFFTEGVFTKSALDLNMIEDKELFFGQKVFFGAIKLNFPITTGDTNRVLTHTFPKESNVLKAIQPKEADGGEDIQREGVLNGDNSR